jgi:hypothetical protein
MQQFDPSQVSFHHYPSLPKSMYKQRRSSACNKACMNVCVVVARTGAELLQRPPADVVVVGSERLTARPLGIVAVDGSVKSYYSIDHIS